MSVEDLDSRRPHLTIQTEDGRVHVCPVSMIKDMASGSLPITDVSDWEGIVQVIIKEWLSYTVGGEE